MKKDGEGIKGFKMPTAKDLEAAFDQADVDKGGTVDEEEYILIYAKVRRGGEGARRGRLRCAEKDERDERDKLDGGHHGGQHDPAKPDPGFCVDFQVTLSERTTADFDGSMQKTFKETAGKISEWACRRWSSRALTPGAWSATRSTGC